MPRSTFARDALYRTFCLGIAASGTTSKAAEAGSTAIARRMAAGYVWIFTVSAMCTFNSEKRRQPMRKPDFPTANELLTAIDQEDERQKQALRLHLERNQPHLEVTGKAILLFMAKVLLGAAGIGAFVYWYFRIPLP